MSKNDPIMQRMKENYEVRSRTYLTRRTPVIIRLDGKAFHTYTRGLEKPFDEGLIEDMAETAKFLCEEIQGAKCAYVQPDEISILITDYDKLNSEAWFDYQVQKMTSVSASIASAKFNQLRGLRFLIEKAKGLANRDGGLRSLPLAFFDSRVFNIPKEEVSNYFLARQRDAVKNSVSMLAQSLYSHKELHKKTSSEKQDMCFQKGHNWNDLHYTKKRGSWIVKNTYANKELLYEDDNYFRFVNTGDVAWKKTSNRPEELVIRTKWESVETPFKFDNTVFENWL